MKKSGIIKRELAFIERIQYTNGAVEYNDEQSYFMPDTQDEIYQKDVGAELRNTWQ